METAKQNTQQNIEENDALKQFMGLLNRQGMGEQSQDFMELFQYVAGMQLQLAVMTDELQGVKEQLSQLRENQPKTVTESLVDKVTHLQEKIANLSERLSAVKDHLAETATQAFNAFKEKGKAEMCKVLQKGISGVKSVLADCREHLVDVMMDYKKTANQISRNDGSDNGRSLSLTLLNLHLRYNVFFLFPGNKYPRRGYATAYQNPARRHQGRLRPSSHVPHRRTYGSRTAGSL